MGDNGRSLLHSRRNPLAQGYSTFDPGGSIDSGLSSGTEYRPSRTNAIPSAIEDARESVSISWEEIDVFVEQPGPSCFRRLCFETNENERPASKQVLFKGR